MKLTDSTMQPDRKLMYARKALAEHRHPIDGSIGIKRELRNALVTALDKTIADAGTDHQKAWDQFCHAVEEIEAAPPPPYRLSFAFNRAGTHVAAANPKSTTNTLLQHWQTFTAEHKLSNGILAKGWTAVSGTLQTPRQTKRNYTNLRNHGTIGPMFESIIADPTTFFSALDKEAIRPIPAEARDAVLKALIEAREVQKTKAR